MEEKFNSKVDTEDKHKHAFPCKGKILCYRHIYVCFFTELEWKIVGIMVHKPENNYIHGFVFIRTLCIIFSFSPIFILCFNKMYINIKVV